MKYLIATYATAIVVGAFAGLAFGILTDSPFVSFVSAAFFTFVMFITLK